MRITVIRDLAAHAEQQHERCAAALDRTDTRAVMFSSKCADSSYVQGYAHALSAVADLISSGHDPEHIRRLLTGYAVRAEQYADECPPKLAV